jgi:hypothetical protein
MTEMEMEGRWLTVSPQTTAFPQLAFVKADTDERCERVGSQTADYATLVFGASDFDTDYKRLLEAGVNVRSDPVMNPWGTEVTFADPFRNVHSGLEPAE